MIKHLAKERFMQKFDRLYQAISSEQQDQYTSLHTFYSDGRLIYDPFFWQSLNADQRTAFGSIREEYMREIE